MKVVVDIQANEECCDGCKYYHNIGYPLYCKIFDQTVTRVDWNIFRCEKCLNAEKEYNKLELETNNVS